ncbi:AI-2E family transporter [Phenylobacterium sp.]|uniref:AI-2E family transporter n=1 Tax=Phenylobacterium sp. TaxID=1871053 RepID=UPI0025ED8767|nr:AI-2E family transporter [Phenylobacterium sp.]
MARQTGLRGRGRGSVEEGGQGIDQMRVLKLTNIVIAVILAGGALWALRRILEPFVLAVFLLIMVDGLARGIARRAPRLPAWSSVPIALAVIVGSLGLTIWLTSQNIADFATRTPVYEARLNALLLLGAQQLGVSATPTVTSLLHQLNPARFAGDAAKALGSFGEGAVFALIYLGFLVASRASFGVKAAKFFRTDGEREEAGRVFERIRVGVERYVWVQTLVGVVIAALSAVLMTALGLSHVPFWCVIIFMTNYIPAIGAAVGVLFPATFGVVEFGELWQAIVLIAGLEAIHFAVSHVLQPRLQGRSLNLDPIVVLLALALWGALWGVVGALLSTPLTVVALAIFAEFEATRPLAVLLSSDGEPYARPDA